MMEAKVQPETGAIPVAWKPTHLSLLAATNNTLKDSLSLRQIISLQFLIEITRMQLRQIHSLLPSKNRARTRTKSCSDQAARRKLPAEKSSISTSVTNPSTQWKMKPRDWTNKDPGTNKMSCTKADHQTAETWTHQRYLPATSSHQMSQSFRQKTHWTTVAPS